MEFFNENYRSKGKTLLSSSGSLTLTAANGLNFPYVGYFELDVEALGVTIPKLGILVVEDSVDDVTRQRKQEVPGLLGMNVIGQVRRKTQNRTFLGNPTSAWADVLRINPKETSYVPGFAKVAGKQDAHVSTRSGAMVVVTG